MNAVPEGVPHRTLQNRNPEIVPVPVNVVLEMIMMVGAECREIQERILSEPNHSSWRTRIAALILPWICDCDEDRIDKWQSNYSDDTNPYLS